MEENEQEKLLKKIEQLQRDIINLKKENEDLEKTNRETEEKNIKLLNFYNLNKDFIKL